MSLVSGVFWAELTASEELGLPARPRGWFASIIAGHEKALSVFWGDLGSLAGQDVKTGKCNSRGWPVLLYFDTINCRTRDVVPTEQNRVRMILGLGLEEKRMRKEEGQTGESGAR